MHWKTVTESTDSDARAFLGRFLTVLDLRRDGEVSETVKM